MTFLNISSNVLGGVLTCVFVAIGLWAWRVLKQLGKILHSLHGLPILIMKVASLELLTTEHGRQIADHSVQIASILSHIGIGSAQPAPVTVNVQQHPTQEVPHVP